MVQLRSWYTTFLQMLYKHNDIQSYVGLANIDFLQIFKQLSVRITKLILQFFFQCRKQTEIFL